MGGSPQIFFQVSKAFVSDEYKKMVEQAEADPRLASTFGLRQIYDEYISTPTTESLLFQRAEEARAALGGISHYELDRQMEGRSLGFWIFMKRSNGKVVIVDTPQSPDYEFN